MFGKNPNNSKDLDSISDKEILILASKVVDRYASKGSIPHREKEDIAMSVVEKFLTKKETIIKNFQGKAKLSTYYISVLNNMCCEVIRREVKHWNIQDNEQLSQEISTINSLDKLAINDEIRYLHKVILLFGDEMNKIRLFTAYFLYLSIIEHDMQKYDNEYLNHKLKELLKVNENMSKGEIFKTLSEIVNIVENKTTKPDSVRMWLNKIRKIIIERLNFSNDTTQYDTETFHILFEYYYTGYDNDTQNIILNNLRHGK